MVPETLHQTVLDFLNSVSSAKRKKVVRCGCGAVMKYQNATFFYEGRNWDVELPICFKCHPIRHSMRPAEKDVRSESFKTN
jgi:hypothetical protein